MPRKKSTKPTPVTPPPPPPIKAPVAKRLYTKQEAATMLTISLRTIDRLIALQKLGAIKLGASIRIPDYEIERLVTEGTDVYFADVYGRKP